MSALDDARAKYGAPKSALDAAREKYSDAPKTSIAETALLHGAQGASFGLADELTGVATAIVDNPLVRKLREKLGPFTKAAFGDIAPDEIPVATTREGKVIKPPVDDAPKSVGEAYRGGRDSVREALEQTRKDHGTVALGSELLTGILNPIKVPIRGAGLGRSVARAGVDAAAYGAGASQADLTKGEVLKFGGDVLKSGGVGAAAGGAGVGVGKLANYAVGGNAVDRLQRRVLNELAEGDGKTTPTMRKHLDKAGKAILEEAVQGPDSKVIREIATEQAAVRGREKLAPIIERVSSKIDDGYATFEKAGRATVDSVEYADRLNQALQATKSLAEKRGIEKVMTDFGELVQRNGDAPLSLREVRAFTTEIQGIAESAIGGLTPHAAAKLKSRLSAVATGVMDDMLDVAASGDKGLTAAAKQIRENNRRMYALLTVDKVLKLREAAEGSARSGFRHALDKGGAAVATGGAAGLLSLSQDPEHVARNIGLGLGVGALARGLPAIGRAIDRGVTTRAIEATQRGTRDVRSRVAERLARPFGAMAGRTAARKQTEDDKETTP